MKQLQRFLQLFLLAMLTACGGGEPLDGGTNSSGGETPPPPATTTISVSIDKTQISNDSPGIVSAKVETNGSPVEGVVVYFETDLGIFDVESASALTNSEGIATIGLKPTDVSGAGTVTAKLDSGESGTVGFESAGDGLETGGTENPTGERFELTLNISSPQVSANSPQTVTANLASTTNGLIAGAVIQFTADSGFLLPASGTALTDSQGNATIIINADTIAGAGTVTAVVKAPEKAKDTKGEVSFANAGDGSAVAGKQVNLTLSSNQISAASPATVTVTVTNAGNPVANEVVNFSSTLGVFDPSSGTALTNESGVATITLKAGNVEGAGLVTATVLSGEYDSIGFATQGDAQAITGNEVSLSISNTSVNKDANATLTAMVTNNGVAIAGEVVNFSATLGALSPVSGTALTNADGKAIITLTAGTVAGAGVASVTLDNGANATVGFETAGDDIVDSSKNIALSISSTMVSEAAPATVTAVVSDSNGPIAGEVVNFSSSLGVFAPVSGTALTDSKGTATIVLTAGDVEGAGVVTARLTTGELDTLGFATKGDASDVGGKSVAISISNANVTGAGQPAELRATVTDGGAPVAGEVVNFAATLGTLSPASGTALTNSDGVATINLTAGQVAGAGVASATLDNGANAKVGFETDGLEAVAETILTLTFKDNQSLISNDQPATLIVKLENNGQAVAREVITFTTSLGKLNPISGTALTDSNGEAAITLTAGDIAGAGIVTATASTGETDTIGFATAGDEISFVGKLIVIESVIPTSLDGTEYPDEAITAKTPAIVTVKVTDASGVVANEVVNFSSTLGVFSPASGTALTDSTGTATIVLNAGNVEGAGLVSASLVSGERDSKGFATIGDASVTPGKSVRIDTAPFSLTDADSVATVTAIVTDGGKAVFGEVVNFSSTLGNLQPLSGTALTDIDGKATIEISAGDVAGAGVVTATLDNDATARVGFETSGLEEPPVTTINFINPSLVSLSGSDKATFKVEVMHGSAPAKFEVIEFTSTLGNLHPSSGTALTNEQGVASITVSTGDVAGAGLLTAKTLTAEVDTIGFETAGDETPVVTKSIVMDAISADISAVLPATVSVTVEDANGDPLYGEIVDFSSSLGVLSPASGRVLTEESTDASGNPIAVATIQLIAGDVEGAGIVTATLLTGEQDSTTFYTQGNQTVLYEKTARINKPLTQFFSLADNNPVQTVEVQVVDDEGKPLNGELVYFSSSLGKLNPLSGTALTKTVKDKDNNDIDGIATIQISRGYVAGADALTVALDNGYVTRVNFETDGLEVDPVTTINFVTPSFVSLSGAGKVTFEVEVMHGSAPAKFEVVEFTSTLGNLHPTSGTALTNDQGKATIQLSAGDIAGAGLLTAKTLTGEVDTIGFETAGDETPVTTKSIVMDAISADITKGSPATVRVSVADADGNPLVGEIVDFSSTLGVLSPVSGRVLTQQVNVGTDDNPEYKAFATIQLNTGLVEGAGIVTATLLTGEQDSKTFYTKGDADPINDKKVIIKTASFNLDASNPVQTVEVQILDRDDNPLNGEIVNFSSSLGNLNPASGAAITKTLNGVDGIAIIEISGGDIAGAGVLTATLDNGAVARVNFETKGLEPSDVTTINFIKSPSVSLSGATSEEFEVKVMRGNVPAQYEVVTFESTLGNLHPSSGTALTNSDGIAKISVSAGDVVGAGLLTATTSTGEVDTIGFHTAGDEPSAVTKSIVMAAISADITKVSPATVRVSVADADGKPLYGEIVDFSSTLGVLSPASGRVLTEKVEATDDNGLPITDNNGQQVYKAEATILLTAGDVEGAGIVTATLLTGEQDSKTFYTKGDAAEINDKKIIINTASFNLDASNPVQTVEVQVLDRDDNPLDGEIVNFSSSLGKLSPSSGTVMTVNGLASIDISQGAIAGADVLTATLDNGAVARVNFETAGSEVVEKVISIDSIDIGSPDGKIAEDYPATITVSVSDLYGNALEGELVTFTSTLGVFSPESKTALTKKYPVLDEQGNPVQLNGVDVTEVVAKIQLLAGDVAGAGIVTATTSTFESDSIAFETVGKPPVTVSVKLVKPGTENTANEEEMQTIDLTNPGKLVATVTGFTKPVLVSFSSDIGEIPIPTAVTSLVTSTVDGVIISEYKASLDIIAGDTLGAGTVTAKLVDDESGETLVVVGAVDLKMGYAQKLDENDDPYVEGTGQVEGKTIFIEAAKVDVTNISAGGTAVFTAQIFETGAGGDIEYTDSDGNVEMLKLYEQPIVVDFTSSCVLAGEASIDSPVTTIRGEARATYAAQGCEGQDVITASASTGGINLSVSQILEVDSPVLGSIQFVSATPENISLQGTGGEESSTLLFQVLDVNGNPMAGETVNFTLNTEVGGLTTSPATADTNADGYVQTIVNAGTIATSVRVTATVANSGVLTQSSSLTVTTGIPDQDSFSIAAPHYNHELIYGETVTITARLGDAFNNPIPLGTAVTFRSEGGLVDGECTIEEVGGRNPSSCDVTFTIQEPIPADGRITVLATAIGNESFVDLDGDGYFDSGDTVIVEDDTGTYSEEMKAFRGVNPYTGQAVSDAPYDLAEAFVDHNEDGCFNPQPYEDPADTTEFAPTCSAPVSVADEEGASEEFVDFNGSGVYDYNDGKYNGVLCKGKNCSEQTSLNIRDSIVIVLGSSKARITPEDPVVYITGDGTAVATVYVSDLKGQPMPKGTEILFSSTVGSIASTNPLFVPNDTLNYQKLNRDGDPYSVTIKGEKLSDPAVPLVGDLIVTVKSPSGDITEINAIQIVIQ
ncbi:beta strand repeat-containing protein [Thalassotalea maritima]|uniref:beta strand repeat-containing protein n=1 Tax=Thalassotalea maritima TaxID=3242416 RepID=UPI003529C7CB